ncbi:MAG: NADAR domain-containing protein [Cyanobacteria bacterium J06638_28]
MTIYFYTTADDYGFLCNFAPYGVAFDGLYWPTVEHYFQAQKFPEFPAHQAQIARVKIPKQAKALGWERSVKLRSDWETVKDAVMKTALFKKFQTHSKIRERLLATATEDLVENAPGDYSWGCGADGSGQN